MTTFDDLPQNFLTVATYCSDQKTNARFIVYTHGPISSNPENLVEVGPVNSEIIL